MQGIVLNSQIPLRAEKTHRSEMVSQLLFGETFTVLDRMDNWILIKTDFDNYIGWIDEISFNELNAKYDLITVCNKYLKIVNDAGDQMIISGGAMIPKPNNDNQFAINNKIYKIDDSNELITNSNIIDSAKQFISASYLWGGRTFMGFDCSGFVQVVYKMNNLSIPRDASEQIKFGNAISIIQEANKGDLLFFGDEENITHVGILIDSDHVIHCSGEVKIDYIDNTGIFDGKKYTHFLRGIKSYQQF